MRLYELMNKENQDIIIFRCGYNREDMWKRNPELNRDEWTIIYCEYID